MKLFFKITLALIVLLFIAIIGFALVFNPNDYKEDIISLAKEKTGRDLSIPGDISLSLFPWIGIDLGAVEFSNAKGFGKQPFAKMSHFQVRVKLWPLIKQQLEADTIVIEGLQLNLAKNKRGISNWDDLTKKTAQSATKKTIQKPAKTPTKANHKKDNSKNMLAAVALNGLKIKNAQFNWHDQQQKQKVSIKNVQLSIGQLRAATKIPLSFQFHLQEKSLDAQIKFSSQIMFSSDAKQFSFHDTELTSNLKLASFKKPLSPQFNSTLMKLDLNKQLFTTNDLNLKLDDTHISGSANIPFASGSSTINMLVDNINLDRYLPEPATTDKKSSPAKNKTTAKKTSKKDEAILIPVALLGAFNVNADFKIKKLQIKNTHWENLHLVAHSKNGQIQIKPLTMQGYNAKILSNFKIKTVKNNALLSGNLNVKNIKAGLLLNDLIGKDKLKGKTSIVASFDTAGIKLSQLKQNLNGKLKLNLKDGTFKGYDLNHQLKVLDAKVKGKTVPATPVPEETKIANLDASAIIKNGILNNKDLRASTPLSRIIGRGTVNLVKEQINYVATIKFTTSTDIKINTSFEKMKSLPLDIIIRGTFDNPDVKVDFQKAINSIIKKELKKQEQKIKEKVTKDVQKELEKKLGDELKNLLKF